MTEVARRLELEGSRTYAWIVVEEMKMEMEEVCHGISEDVSREILERKKKIGDASRLRILQGKYLGEVKERWGKMKEKAKGIVIEGNSVYWSQVIERAMEKRCGIHMDLFLMMLIDLRGDPGHLSTISVQSLKSKRDRIVEYVLNGEDVMGMILFGLIPSLYAWVKVFIETKNRRHMDLYESLEQIIKRLVQFGGDRRERSGVDMVRDCDEGIF